MQIHSPRDAIAAVWGGGDSKDITAEAVTAQMRLDGGLDSAGISVRDMELLLDGATPKHWDRVIFAAHELLSRYEAYEGDLSREQIATALFCACIMGQAARAGETDSDSYNDAIVRIFNMLSDEELTSSHAGEILNYAFAKKI
jgi:hypothetical protein